MSQVVVLEQSAPQRDALAYVLREAGLSVTATDDPAAVRDPLVLSKLRLIIVGERDLPRYRKAVSGRLPRLIPLVVLTEPGSFRGIVEGLCEGAADIVSRERPASELIEHLRAVLADHFAGQDFVSVAPAEECKGLDALDPEGLNGTNDMRLYVFGNAAGDQAVLATVLDNLGKGASGAAVQNMNLMLGLDPQAGLATRLAA